ncbi:MAG: hypothetical protein KDG49_13675 [Geminicoccaceae bacterium]|jgi:hypothetical protein|nr:hypothetical protein [Geminicoccaceae bacterium]
MADPEFLEIAASPSCQTSRKAQSGPMPERRMAATARPGPIQDGMLRSASHHVAVRQIPPGLQSATRFDHSANKH